MKHFFFLFILLFHFQIARSQDYAAIDTIVSNYPKKFKSIKSFANHIELDFKTDIEKTRAAYYWISNNIVYDYKSFRSNENGYGKIEYKSEENYQNSLLNLQKKYAEDVLKKKLGVCEGYSQLLKFTLEYLKVECEVITGYAKNSNREIGVVRNGENHAWNAVKINNEWKLIDATWSAGNDEKNPGAFNFTDAYFFIKPEYLILSHLPIDDHWQLLETTVSKKNFFFQPIFYYTYFDSELKINNDQSGLIKVKKNGIIKLKFDKANTNRIYRYDLQQDQYASGFLVEKENDFYIADILFPHERNSVLTIFENDLSIMEFKIIVEK